MDFLWMTTSFCVGLFTYWWCKREDVEACMLIQIYTGEVVIEERACKRLQRKCLVDVNGKITHRGRQWLLQKII